MNASYATWNEAASADLLPKLGLGIADCQKCPPGSEFKIIKVPFLQAYSNQYRSPRSYATFAAGWVLQRLHGLSQRAQHLRHLVAAGEHYKAADFYSQLRTEARKGIRMAYDAAGPIRKIDPKNASMWQQLLKTATQVIFHDFNHLEDLTNDLGTLHDGMRAVYETLTKAEAREQAASWTTWMETALSRGAGQAHRYCKGVEVELDALQSEGRWTCDPVAKLQDDYHRWKGLWCPSGQPHTASRDADEQKSIDDFIQFGDAIQEGITPKDIGQASLAFKERTVAVDGYHPRHFSMMHTSVLRLMIVVIKLVELTGSYPDTISSVLITLIGGKRRPIGLFRSFIRVHQKARQFKARQWERMHGMQLFFNTGPHRSTTDATWRGLVKSNLWELDQQVSCEVNYDFSKFYEHMHYFLLIQQATATSYPLGSCVCHWRHTDLPVI